MLFRTPSRFRKTLLASLIGTALAPHSALALDFAQAPPGTVEPYVAPNVILSLDNSGSMGTMDMMNGTKSRRQVLKEALKAVFNDTTLLPDRKIRLAWQALGPFTVSGLNIEPLGTAIAASSTVHNRMRVLDTSHRTNFIKYVDAFTGDMWTPTHFLVKRADDYMRAPLNLNGPWADTPGETLASATNDNKPLGCRRNYHIMLTDGQWNGYYYGPQATYYDASSPYKEVNNNNTSYPAEDINTDPINYDNQDSNTFKAYGRAAGSSTATGTNAIANVLGNDPSVAPKDYPGFVLPDGTLYSRANSNTWLYRDIDYLTYSDMHEGYLPCKKYKLVSGKRECDDLKSGGGRRGGLISSLSDWTFKSWASPLQPASNLSGQVSPLPDYEKAPPTETFENKITKKTATLQKYWNPRYNPATWPHMVTFTIGFSKDAIPTDQYRPIGKTADVASNIGVYWNTTTRKNEIGWRKDELLWEQNGPYVADSSNPDTNNGNNGTLITPSSTLPYGYDGSFADYAAGRAQWYAVKGGEANQDMWHAAINGRGQFYAVEKGEDLKKAFEQIVRTINAETEPDRGSTATSGSNASQNDVGIFTANYVPKEGWRGSVSSEVFKSSDGTTEQAWDGKTTADKLDALTDISTRLVLTWNDTIRAGQTTPVGGAPFKWTADNANFSPDQKTLLTRTGTDGGPTGTVGANGDNRVKFLRGARGLECPASGCTPEKPFRQRWSSQGSIVNSEVWYVGAPVSNYALNGYPAFTRTWSKRKPMLYVGGNDGMLHGFTAEDGTERIAYVPRGVIRDLSKLTNPSFNNNHQYFVDGSPMTGDVFDSAWKTLLIGTLGAGGRGYFILDVTNPGKTDSTSSSNFTETNANSLVVMDKTQPPSTTTVGNDDVDDLGHIFAKPVMDDANLQRTTQIVRMNNNRWAAVMGNGYNSANGRAVLLIQYLDGAKELLRIPTLTTDTNNGLSAPRLVDISGDGRPDVVYAGDLKGNLWKFLINTEDPSQWGLAMWEGKAAGTPLFTANRGTGHSANTNSSTRQSITAVPSVRVNDRTKKITDGDLEKTVFVGGMMVAFGTGRNITKLDQAEQQQQTLYSVLDNTRYEREMTGTAPNEKPTGRVKVCATTGGACGKLVKTSADLPQAVAQSDLVQSTIPDAAAQTRDGRQFWKVNATTLNWSEKKGWFLDFPETRERLLKPMQFYDGSNLLAVSTQIPAKGSRLDPAVESCEGGAVDKERQFVTFINIMDGQAPRVPIIDGVSDLARYSMPPGALTMIVKDNRIHMRGRQPKPGGTGTDLVEEKMRRMPEMSLRPNWRQLK